MIDGADHKTYAGASSFNLSITDKFVASDDYQLKIYFGYDSKIGAKTCFALNGNGYRMIRPLH